MPPAKPCPGVPAPPELPAGVLDHPPAPPPEPPDRPEVAGAPEGAPSPPPPPPIATNVPKTEFEPLEPDEIPGL